MIINRLTVENIKRIKAVEITPDGDVVRIGGKNANGKSSVLDSISMLFCGKKLIPERPVRDGEETAKIEAEAGDYIMSRHWTSPEKSYLTLKNRDGAKFSNAQTILDSMTNGMAFDPIEFSLAKPAERIEQLKQITGIDFSVQEKQYSELYTERTAVNRELKSLKARAPEKPDFEDLPEKTDINELQAKIEESRKLEKSKEQIRQEALEANRKLNHLDELIQSGEKEIIMLNEKIEKIRNENKLRKENMEDFKQIAVKLNDKYESMEIPSTDEIWAEFESAQKHNREVDEMAMRLKEYDMHKAKLASAQHDLDEIEDSMQLTKDNMRKMVEKAEMPIEGLSIEGGASDVLFNQMPFSQLSTSEQIRISMAIAMAKNPKLKVVIIKNGSLMDSDALKIVSEMASEKSFQVWIEQVADSKQEGMVYIQDGELS